MIAATRKMRSPLKVHGGKSYLARRIVAHFPEHTTYVEPFCGGCSVLLNKPTSEVEVAGDLDGSLIDFWFYLRDHADRLVEYLADIPYTAEVFENADLCVGSTDDLTHAAAFLVRNRFSRGGLGKDFAWSDRLRGGQPGDANAWDTIRRDLPRLAERIEGVEFRCTAAAELLVRLDGPDTLFYCDPPYLHETRTHRDAYAHEMTREDHEALLQLLLRCRGKVVLSGYRSGLYDDLLAGWRRVEFSIANHSGQGKSKQRRTECLWLKP
jgi:DNA adenine methylase